MGTLLRMKQIIPWGDLIFLVDLKPLPSSLICIVCQGGDRHHALAVMDVVELSAMYFDWTHFDFKEKPPETIFQLPERLFILIF